MAPSKAIGSGPRTEVSGRVTSRVAPATPTRSWISAVTFTVRRTSWGSGAAVTTPKVGAVVSTMVKATGAVAQFPWTSAAARVAA